MNTLYVAFMRLIASAETTWQTTKDDFLVVMHVLQDINPQTATKWCFWCASMNASCSTKVVTGSKKGMLVLQSDCPAANTCVQWGRLCKGARGRPCTNRPLSCLGSGKTIFSYVMAQHWGAEHPNSLLPPTFCDYPSEAEFQQVAELHRTMQKEKDAIPPPPPPGNQ